MNNKAVRSKMGLLDIEVNFLSKLLFVLMMALAAVITIFNGLNENAWLFFMRNVLLLQSIIPISLRVNLDMAKLYYSYCINTDEQIAGTVARNSNIPEDLGRLSYLITDKTGTLTQNEMILKKVCIEAAIFESEDQTVQEILAKNCEKHPDGPCNDSRMVSAVSGADSKKRKRRDEANNLRDLLTAFAICNNVTPVVEDPDIG